MKKQFLVTGTDLNFRLCGTRCITGQTVELDPDDHVVALHIAQGDLTEVITRKEIKHGKS